MHTKQLHKGSMGFLLNLYFEFVIEILPFEVNNVPLLADCVGKRESNMSTPLEMDSTGCNKIKIISKNQ